VTAPRTAPATSTAGGQEPADRPMGAIYLAVIVVEIVTLLALWWFQTTFGRA
jgi:hypothetical protein